MFMNVMLAVAFETVKFCIAQDLANEFFWCHEVGAGLLKQVSTTVLNKVFLYQIRKNYFNGMAFFSKISS